MSTIKMYQLVLLGPIGPSPASTENHWLNDENTADLLVALNGDQTTTDESSPSETARLILEEIEKDGRELEEALQADIYASQDGLNIFSDLPSISPVNSNEPSTTVQLTPFNTETEALLRDLESILPEVASSSTEQPTSFTELDELVFLRSLNLPYPDGQTDYLPPTPSSLSPNNSPILQSPIHASTTPLSQASPVYASSTSSNSPYPVSTTSWDSDSTSDPDWTYDDSNPGPIKKNSVRPKPYTRPSGRGRHPEERKERKKIQNKNAATRYRVKKKSEEEELLTEEIELQEKNRELTDQVNELANEVRIVKNLLRDHCKRLGIIKD